MNKDTYTHNTTNAGKIAITGMGVITPQNEFLEDFLESALDGKPFVQSYESLQNPAENSDNNIDTKTPAALTVRNIIRTMQVAGRSLASWREQRIALVFYDNEQPVSQLKNTLHLQGPILQLSSGTSLSTGLQQARNWLNSAEAEAVVLASPYSAVFLVDQKKAEQENQAVFALVEATGTGSNSCPTEQCIHDACQTAIEEAGILPHEIDYLELTGNMHDEENEEEFAALSHSYRSEGADLSCAAGSLYINNGNHQAAHEICRLVKTALCIYHRQIPATPDWNGPRDPGTRNNTPFYISTESRTWFVTAAQRRLAAINLVGQSHECTHIILSESEKRRSSDSSLAVHKRYHMFLMAGDSGEDILAQCQQIRQQCTDEKQLAEAAGTCFERFRTGSQLPLKAALLCHDTVELSKEIEIAERTLLTSLQKSGEWQTPGGSYATNRPLGKTGEIAFVYPGAFNSYIGIGRDLFRLFPQLHDRFMQVTSQPGRILRERFLYPRSRSVLSAEQKAALEEQFKSDAIAMLTSGTSLSILYTMVLQDIFGIKPQAAFGYSLGENSMMFATGVWNNGDEVNACLENSPLFHTRLAGPHQAAREYWRLDPEEKTSQELWASYVLMVSPDIIKSALQAEKRVYLTHINTPRQVVIAGDPAACLRVIQMLGNPMHLRAPFNYALHCEAMRSEQESLKKMHSWPVQQIPETRLYTADGCRRLPLEREKIADGLGKMLCECVDFPHLVDQVYADGARIFIEVGAGSNCAKWTGDTLKSRPHLAISINRQGVDDHTSIMRLLAKLACHDVLLNLEPVFQ